MEQTFTIVGVIDTICQTESYNTKDGAKYKRSIWLETGEKYKNYSEIIFSGQAVDKLDNFHVGDEVWVKIQIGGRKWEKNGDVKIITVLTSFAIGLIAKGEQQPPKQEPKHVTLDEPIGNQDDMPF
jgi:hypothetical protein